MTAFGLMRFCTASMSNLPRLVFFSVSDPPILPMDCDPLSYLLDLGLNSAVPLDQVLLALASDDPCPSLVFQFKAVFVHFV